MCNTCAGDARSMLLLILTAALSTPLDTHTFHGTDVDVNALRTNVAELAQAIVLGGGDATPEQDAAATASGERLAAMPAAMLQDLMAFCEYTEGLFENMHRIAQHSLAVRAMSGEYDAQVRISQLDAIRALAMNGLPDGATEGEVAVVVLGGLGAKVGNHTHRSPNTSDLPH